MFFDRLSTDGPYFTTANGFSVQSKKTHLCGEGESRQIPLSASLPHHPSAQNMIGMNPIQTGRKCPNLELLQN
jgi:hypothetical protein